MVISFITASHIPMACTRRIRKTGIFSVVTPKLRNYSSILSAPSSLPSSSSSSSSSFVPTSFSSSSSSSVSSTRYRTFSSEIIQHPSGINLYSQGKGVGLGLPPSRSPLYQESPLSEFASRYYYLFKLMGVFGTKSRIGQGCEALYRSIEEQSIQNRWFTELNLPHTWITEHSLLALHVWIFHNRFKIDYNVNGEFSGRRLQEELFQHFWNDTMKRIRAAGVSEMSVTKQLEHVQKLTFDDFFTYDAAIKVENDDNMELAAALWKGIFREHEHANTEAVIKLADYTKREVFNVLLQPAEDIYRGWVTWGPIVGESEAERLQRQRSMLEGEWREGIALNGRVYFYHTTTHERRWDPPTEGLYNRRRFALKTYLEGHPEIAARIGSTSNGTIRTSSLPGPTENLVSSSSSPSAKSAKELFGKKTEKT